MATKPIQDPFAKAIVNLRAHMLKCYACRATIGGGEPEPPCVKGWAMCVEVTRTCAKLLEQKRMAVNTINGYVYVCPDLSAHGEAYALTAQPLSVTGVQTELF